MIHVFFSDNQSQSFQADSIHKSLRKESDYLNSCEKFFAKNKIAKVADEFGRRERSEKDHEDSIVTFAVEISAQTNGKNDLRARLAYPSYRLKFTQSFSLLYEMSVWKHCDQSAFVLPNCLLFAASK